MEEKPIEFEERRAPGSKIIITPAPVIIRPAPSLSPLGAEVNKITRAIDGTSVTNGDWISLITGDTGTSRQLSSGQGLEVPGASDLIIYNFNGSLESAGAIALYVYVGSRLEQVKRGTGIVEISPSFPLVIEGGRTVYLYASNASAGASGVYSSIWAAIKKRGQV